MKFQSNVDFSTFDWTAFLQGAQIADVDTLVVMENTAIPGIAQVFADTPIETLKAWQAFQVVDQASPYLSNAFVDSRFDFRGKTLRGQPENRPVGRCHPADPPVLRTGIEQSVDPATLFHHAFDQRPGKRDQWWLPEAGP